MARGPLYVGFKFVKGPVPVRVRQAVLLVKVRVGANVVVGAGTGGLGRR